MGKLGENLHGGLVDDEEIVRVRETLLFEEPERKRKLTRFFYLLIFATAIATFGLLADSIATVIGAMIVAPLMLPIMGVAFGVSLGDRKVIQNSLITSILGIMTAIALGFLLTWTFRSVVNVEANVQTMSRTAPRLIDLCAALATGLAGAFATGRRDVSDTLPGVATQPFEPLSLNSVLQSPPRSGWQTATIGSSLCMPGMNGYGLSSPAKERSRHNRSCKMHSAADSLSCRSIWKLCPRHGLHSRRRSLAASRDSPHDKECTVHAMNLASPRLLLTPFQPEDVVPFEALYTDEQVRRYLGGPRTREQARIRFQDYLTSPNANRVWAVRLKADNRFIGTVDLQEHHDGIDTEISYLFLPTSWGNGYAGEAVRAILTYAMDELGLSRVIAETQTANLASCRLLERCGMTRERTLTRFGAEQAIYTTQKSSS